jgi:hypothetical protein
MLERNHLIFKPLKQNTVQVFAGDPFQKLGVEGRPLRWILKGVPLRANMRKQNFREKFKPLHTLAAGQKHLS